MRQRQLWLRIISQEEFCDERKVSIFVLLLLILLYLLPRWFHIVCYCFRLLFLGIQKQKLCRFILHSRKILQLLEASDAVIFYFTDKEICWFILILFFAILFNWPIFLKSLTYLQLPTVVLHTLLYIFFSNFFQFFKFLFNLVSVDVFMCTKCCKFS